MYLFLLEVRANIRFYRVLLKLFDVGIATNSQGFSVLLAWLYLGCSKAVFMLITMSGVASLQCCQQNLRILINLQKKILEFLQANSCQFWQWPRWWHRWTTDIHHCTISGIQLMLLNFMTSVHWFFYFSVPDITFFLLSFIWSTIAQLYPAKVFFSVGTEMNGHSVMIRLMLDFSIILFSFFYLFHNFWNKYSLKPDAGHFWRSDSDLFFVTEDGSAILNFWCVWQKKVSAE